MSEGRVSGSFRDPSGFVFSVGGKLYRQINLLYKDHYDCLMNSGLYRKLVETNRLIPHTEAGLELARTEAVYRVIKPEIVPFVSYPYEWCFSQLKDAALTTLDIQKMALDFGMTLKDASAYNIQYVQGQALLIDTLSFETYQEGTPWIAYKQFCQHFLAPLALMSYRDVKLAQLLRVYLDGVPLALASALLPARTRLKPGLLIHLHLHAATQKRFADATRDAPIAQRKVSKQALRGLIDSLQSAVKGLQWKPFRTDWAAYYQGDSYDSQGFEHKQQLVEQFIKETAPTSVWDLGANTGVFSRIASAQGIPTVSWDIDPGAVELNYREVVSKCEESLLPLVLDLTNPSPALGWVHEERESFMARGGADMVIALALIHHLAITNNVPLGDIARFLARLCNWLIIEFIPKSDPKAQKLLAFRTDIFSDYTPEGFEAAFERHFTVVHSERIANSERCLYLMKRK